MRIVKALMLVMLIAVTAWGQSDPTTLVDPFVGTQVNALNDMGNTVPGAVRPFGMMYWSPDPVQGNRYSYTNPTTHGFALTHLNGEGCGIYGDVPILPILGVPALPAGVKPPTYGDRYDPKEQVAEPGYYEVLLKSGIRVRLAADVHSGAGEIGFPAGEQAHTLIFALSENLTRVLDADIAIQGDEVSGSVTGAEFCGTNNRYTVYFVAKAQQPFAGFGTWDEFKVTPGSHASKGRFAGGYVSFPPRRTRLS